MLGGISIVVRIVAGVKVSVWVWVGVGLGFRFGARFVNVVSVGDVFSVSVMIGVGIGIGFDVRGLVCSDTGVRVGVEVVIGVVIDIDAGVRVKRVSVRVEFCVGVGFEVSCSGYVGTRFGFGVRISGEICCYLFFIKPFTSVVFRQNKFQKF